MGTKPTENQKVFCIQSTFVFINTDIILFSSCNPYENLLKYIK